MSCNKVRYESRKLAKKIARKKYKGIRKLRHRAYKCPDCGGYHLTTFDAKKIKEFKDLNIESAGNKRETR